MIHSFRLSEMMPTWSPRLTPRSSIPAPNLSASAQNCL